MLSARLGDSLDTLQSVFSKLGEIAALTGHSSGTKKVEKIQVRSRQFPESMRKSRGTLEHTAPRLCWWHAVVARLVT